MPECTLAIAIPKRLCPRTHKLRFPHVGRHLGVWLWMKRLKLINEMEREFTNKWQSSQEIQTGCSDSFGQVPYTENLLWVNGVHYGFTPCSPTFSIEILS